MGARIGRKIVFPGSKAMVSTKEAQFHQRRLANDDRYTAKSFDSLSSILI